VERIIGNNDFDSFTGQRHAWASLSIRQRGHNKKIFYTGGSLIFFGRGCFPSDFSADRIEPRVV
jgi:hypothetical protein